MPFRSAQQQRQFQAKSKPSRGIGEEVGEPMMGPTGKKMPPKAKKKKAKKRKPAPARTAVAAPPMAPPMM